MIEFRKKRTCTAVTRRVNDRFQRNLYQYSSLNILSKAINQQLIVKGSGDGSSSKISDGEFEEADECFRVSSSQRIFELQQRDKPHCNRSYLCCSMWVLDMHRETLNSTCNETATSSGDGHEERESEASFCLSNFVGEGLTRIT